MLITTNQSVTLWGQVFGDDVIATAILDRLLHHSPTFYGPGRELSPPPEAQSGAAAAARAAPGILTLIRNSCYPDIRATMECRLE